jgi:perosamine synthetase
MNIPITKVFFTKDEFNNVIKPLESGWVVQGPYVKEFEDKWSKFTGAEYSIAVTNCTTALHLSLVALGINAGDEVIIPSFTWVATANAVEMIGATPVFCDIELDTFNISAEKIKSKITNRTRAIISVHLFGLSADMDPIISIAKKHNLLVIEDAACGFASKYSGTHVGNFGNTGCFSFHPRKAITTGEGGMITTYDKKLNDKLRSMRDHGAIISDHQRHIGVKPYLLPEFPYLGFNYRMTDIQAAIGSSQMDRANDIYKLRSNIAKKYDEFLSNIPWLRIPFRSDNYQHGFQSYVCLFSDGKIDLERVEEIHEKRNRFMDYLFTEGIATRPGTHAVHMLEYYSNKYCLKREDFPNSFIADHCSITFPLFPSLNNEEFDYIKSKIINYQI